MAQQRKNRPAMQETKVWSLSREDPLEEEKATHFSFTAWKVPWTEEPGRLQSKGLQRVGHDWAHTYIHITDIYHCTSFRYIAKWLARSVHYEIIPTISSVNSHQHTKLICVCVCVMRTLKIYHRDNFKTHYSTVNYSHHAVHHIPSTHASSNQWAIPFIIINLLSPSDSLQSLKLISPSQILNSTIPF